MQAIKVFMTPEGIRKSLTARKQKFFPKKNKEGLS
jgi:hypothetical protein